MKIVVCDDDALVYEQMKNIIASYSIVKNENLELTFYQTVEELLGNCLRNIIVTKEACPK